MEGMENNGGSVATAADNEFQLVTNQDGTFAGYTRKSKSKKRNKFATKKEKTEEESCADMPPKAKKLFNLD